MFSTDGSTEPRLQVKSWGDTIPLFAEDVAELKPERPAVIDDNAYGFPFASLTRMPVGDYYVQAVLNIYTQFNRADGHTIWAHMDQWEGQKFNISPGNLISQVTKLHLEPEGRTIRIRLDSVIPPLNLPADTVWLKHIRIQSSILSHFWGHPMYLGATVLLPKDYDRHPDVHYPVIYIQGHFRRTAPFNFDSEYSPETEADRALTKETGWERGYDFYREWSSEKFPRMIAILIQHPTPYFDDSYAVNSVNNGPYGDAIMNELYPYLEEHFRIVRKPYARLLTGGSTGGWESLALQLYHPEFFGGTWTFYPDPVDFRRYGLVDIYSDDNAFVAPDHKWVKAERFFERSPDGQPQTSVQQISNLEHVLGSRGRSGGQLAIWEATYGPIGSDGYPIPLWNKRTGKIDHTVAYYMREHGYDLRYYAESNWSKIGAELIGKLHIYCGDMDDYFLNLAVYLFDDFLREEKTPYYAGSVRYGRPMIGHDFHPMNNASLINTMADYIDQSAPKGEDTAQWRYK